MNQYYQGTIIEESLEDKSVLDGLKVTLDRVELVTEDHKTPWVNQWTFLSVEIPAEKVNEIAEKLSQALDSKHAWYADFKTDADHYILFRGKIFHVTDRSSREQYDKAAQYGFTLGIPEYQLDFSPYIAEWQR